MKKYFFRAGSPFNQKEAQRVGEFLEHVSGGKPLKPKQVVDLARPPRSPIHKLFDWNDETAAEKYRLQQARSILVCLYVKIENNDVRAYENVYLKAIDQNSYVTTEDIFNSKDLTNQVIEQAKRELVYWQSKYVLYKDKLPNIFKAIDALKESKHEKESRKNRGANSDSSNRNKGSRGNNRRHYAASSK